MGRGGEKTKFLGWDKPILRGTNYSSALSPPLPEPFPNISGLVYPMITYTDPKASNLPSYVWKLWLQSNSLQHTHTDTHQRYRHHCNVSGLLAFYPVMNFHIDNYKNKRTIIVMKSHLIHNGTLIYKICYILIHVSVYIYVCIISIFQLWKGCLISWNITAMYSACGAFLPAWVVYESDVCFQNCTFSTVYFSLKARFTWLEEYAIVYIYCALHYGVLCS